MVYFISGHIDATEEFFDDHYRAKIINACKCGADFVVGDAAGVDKMAQELLHIFAKGKVTVYHMLTSPRNNEFGFQTVGGFDTDTKRDEAMTAASDADIAYVQWEKRSNESGRISGTEQNLRRRGQWPPANSRRPLESYSTRELLNMRYLGDFTDEVRSILNEREHIPNKKEGKTLRQKAAKQKE